MTMTNMSTISMMTSFSLSLSLAIVTTVAVPSISIISRLGRSLSLSYSNWLSISLAVVTMVAMASVTICSVTMAPVAMVVARVSEGHTHQEGRTNQKFHVISSSFSTELPM